MSAGLMPAGSAFDLLLVLLLVLAALGAVGARELFAAVACFVVLGVFASVAWARLGAVDVALAEAAIGAGLTGVLLVRAAARLAPHARRVPEQARPRLVGALMTALPCVLLFAVLAGVALDIGQPEGLTQPVQAQLGATGLGNPVTAVLVNFRGYDTLLETVVLLAALLGTWSLCADADWGRRPGLREHARPDGVLASFGRLLPPMGVLVGLHLFWAGADAPGGAFQAGTVLAAVWLLLVLAGASQPPPVTRRRARVLLVAGPALFLLVAAVALPAGGLLVFPPAQAKWLTLAVEAGLTVSIAATLAWLVVGAPESESS